LPLLRPEINQKILLTKTGKKKWQRFNRNRKGKQRDGRGQRDLSGYLFALGLRKNQKCTATPPAELSLTVPIEDHRRGKYFNGGKKIKKKKKGNGLNPVSAIPGAGDENKLSTEKKRKKRNNQKRGKDH